MPLGGLVHRLIGGLVQRHARLLLIVLGGQRLEPLLLGAGVADQLLGSALGDRNCCDGGSESRRIFRAQLQLLTEEPRATELTVPCGGGAVDTERHAVEPPHIVRGERWRHRRRRIGSSNRTRRQKQDEGQKREAYALVAHRTPRQIVGAVNRNLQGIVLRSLGHVNMRTRCGFLLLLWPPTA